MSNWDSQRAKLNHDLLKNQVIPTLDRLKRIVEGRISGDRLFEDCCEHLLSVWFELYNGLQQLLTRADKGSGPYSWFSEDPLNKLDEHDVQWMRALILAHYPNSIITIAKQTLIELTALNIDIKQLISDITSCCHNKDEIANVIVNVFLTKLTKIRKHVGEMSVTLSSMSSNNISQSMPGMLTERSLERNYRNIEFSVRTSLMES